ncbi:MAG: hypothetical protein LBT84_02495 [Spirochaetia bacterium]|jgi:DNA polymerase III delta prime subunit|nr:hypothetical protein [Spirochaetia bacterium]
MNTQGIIGHDIQLSRIKMMLQNGFMPQALLFSGIRGTGKRKIAMRLLMNLFCKEETKPCLECKDCRLIEKNVHPDVIMLLPNEKGSIPIGEEGEEGTVRWLISRLAKKSAFGRYGVIIDGIENMSPGGQNALLKTLEEPPENTLIVMITENKNLILPTILSRASEIAFGPLSAPQLRGLLEERNIYGPCAAAAAGLSGGSVETAVFLSDEENMAALKNIVASAADFVKNRNAIADIDLEPLQKKIGPAALMSILTNTFRAMLLSQIRGGAFPGVTHVDEESLIKLIKISLSVSKGLRVNMLTNISFKGLLYSIDDLPNTGLPGFD